MGLDWCEPRVEDGVVYCERLSWRAPVFRDRVEAGRVLGRLLRGLGVEGEVYALAAGGVPVAYGVAEELDAVFDVVVVKKITYPWTTEAGFGAVAVDGTAEYSLEAAVAAGYGAEELNRVVEETRRLVEERTLRLRGSTTYTPGEKVVVVDDGIATGYTMRVAIEFLRRHGARTAYAAAPTASTDGAVFVAEKADRVVVVNLRTGPYYAVADAYMEWHDVSDEEALAYIAHRGRYRPASGGPRG